VIVDALRQHADKSDAQRGSCDATVNLSLNNYANCVGIHDSSPVLNS